MKEQDFLDGARRIFENARFGSFRAFSRRKRLRNLLLFDFYFRALPGKDTCGSDRRGAVPEP